jgi:serine/threonine protein phosphatase 1
MGDEMKYYVVADVHGFCSILKDTLKKNGFFDDQEPHKLIVCGDLFDRGNEAVELQNFIIELMEKDEVILVKGNHEELLVTMLNGWHFSSYFETYHNTNGTVDTVCQLTNMTLSELYNNPSEAYYRMRETPFMQRILPQMMDYFETKKYIFVHGWIPCEKIKQNPARDTYLPIADWRNASEEQWRFARWINGMDAAHDGVIEEGKIIVCGHWHSSYGHSRYEMKCSEFGDDADFSPYYGTGIIAMDTCTAHSQKINCIIIEE